MADSRPGAKNLPQKALAGETPTSYNQPVKGGYGV